MAETRFLAVPERLLCKAISLLVTFWNKGNLDLLIKQCERAEYVKCIDGLKDIVSGKEHEICPVCGDFLTRDHVYEV